MKRAALIVTDARYVDGVTRRTGGGNDVVEHLWLEASGQLLADLRRVLDLAEGMRQRMLRRPTHFNGYIELEIQEREQADGEAIARVRALLPEGDE